MSTTEMTLGEAARFAGVSQTTVRSWVHKIEGARKLPSGGYSIPMNSLQAYLSARSKGGSGRTGASAQAVAQTAPEQTQYEARLQAEVEYLRGELREARGELKEAQAEIRRLEAEIRTHLSGGVVGAVSRWIKGR